MKSPGILSYLINLGHVAILNIWKVVSPTQTAQNEGGEGMILPKKDQDAIRSLENGC